MDCGLSTGTERFEEVLGQIIVALKTLGRRTIANLLVVLGVSVNTVLVREDKSTKSTIYYIQKILLDRKTRYPYLEKFALALNIVSTKFKQYFNVIIFLQLQLFSYVINRGSRDDLRSGLLNLANVTLQHRTTIKSEVITDFAADFSMGILPEAENRQLYILRQFSSLDLLHKWVFKC